MSNGAESKAARPISTTPTPQDTQCQSRRVAHSRMPSHSRASPSMKQERACFACQVGQIAFCSAFAVHNIAFLTFWGLSQISPSTQVGQRLGIRTVWTPRASERVLSAFLNGFPVRAPQNPLPRGTQVWQKALPEKHSIKCFESSGEMEGGSSL